MMTIPALNPFRQRRRRCARFQNGAVGLLVKGDEIDIIGQANTPIQLTASADSVAEQRALTDLPNEDLIVLLMEAVRAIRPYDIAPPVNVPDELDILVGDASGSSEIIDAATGHSMATRQLDDSGQAAMRISRCNLSAGR